MKTYCMSCGESVEYTIKEPKVCPFCTQDIVMKKIASLPKDKPKKNSIDADELEEFFKQRDKKKKSRHAEDEDDNGDSNDEDDEDLEEYEDDDEDEKPKKKRSKASFVDDEEGIDEMKNMFGFSMPQRTRGEKIANIAKNKAEILPPRNNGKKLTKKQIIAEFQKQAASKTPAIEIK